MLYGFDSLHKVWWGGTIFYHCWRAQTPHAQRSSLKELFVSGFRQWLCAEGWCHVEGLLSFNNPACRWWDLYLKDTSTGVRYLLAAVVLGICKLIKHCCTPKRHSRRFHGSYRYSGTYQWMCRVYIIILLHLGFKNHVVMAIQEVKCCRGWRFTQDVMFLLGLGTGGRPPQLWGAMRSKPHLRKWCTIYTMSAVRCKLYIANMDRFIYSIVDA